MEYIDAAMVGHIGAEATAAIGIVSSSTWLLHGILVGLYTAFSIQIAQYLGADRQQDARGVLRQSMLFNLILGLGAAAFGVGISRFLPGWLGADISLQASSSAYFAIWSAALPFTMAMGMYAAMLRATGDALTPSLISLLVCALDVVFNFFLINPTRQIQLFGQSVTVWGAGLEVPGAALGTALSTTIGGLLALGVGDTIRVSLTDDPVKEVYAAKAILKAVGRAEEGINVVSCPTCGRTRINLIDIAKEVEQRCQSIRGKKMKVAVMGCVVNGPGEAREADLGIAGGDGVGLIFRRGEIIKKVPQEQLVDALMDEIAQYEGE